MKISILRLGEHENIESNDKKIIRKLVDPASSAVVLIAGDQNILVDTGNTGYGDEILSLLDKEGITPDQIDYIINTHLHFDHCSNNHLFRNAKRISGEGVWEKKRITQYFNVEDIDVPGVKIIKTQGHSPDHLSVAALVDGKRYVVAGDAIQLGNILEGNYEDRENQKEIHNSIKKILYLADVIIPGHGKIIQGADLDNVKKIMERY